MAGNQIMAVIAGIALLVTVVVNIVAIAFFAGKLTATQAFLSSAINNIKENFNEKIKELRDDVEQKIDSNNQHTTKNIERLEKKQDKYNNVLERTAICEQSVSSAHHRLDEVRDRLTKFEEGK